MALLAKQFLGLILDIEVDQFAIRLSTPLLTRKDGRVRAGMEIEL